MTEPLYGLTKSQVGRVGDAVRAHEAGGGSPTRSGGRPVKVQILARVAGATKDGANWRWNYTLVKQRKTAAGFGGWADDGDSLQGYNYPERDNGASGIVSGYNLGDPDITGIEPVPDGLLVQCDVWVVGDVVEYWFDHRNDPTLECPDESGSGSGEEA